MAARTSLKSHARANKSSTKLEFCKRLKRQKNNCLVFIFQMFLPPIKHFRANSQTPETLTVDEAVTQFEPQLILVAKEATGTGKDEEIPGFETEKKSFGFRWFIPELLKHKKIWRDVLLTSLSIQLVALATQSS